MAITVRGILLTAVPTLAALFGIFWFRRKKKSPEEDREPEQEVRAESVPKLILTQPSDEGLKVSEINVSEPQLGEIPETDESAPSKAEEQLETTEDIKAEKAPVTCSSMESFVSPSNGTNIVQNISTSEQDTKSDSQSKDVQIDTKPKLVSTDHVEEVIEQSSLATLSKSAPIIKRQLEDSLEHNNGQGDAGLHQTKGGVALENGLAGDSDEDLSQEVKAVQIPKQDAELSGVTFSGSSGGLPEDRKRKCSESLSWEESPSPELAASPVGNCSASTNGSETSVDSGIVATTHPTKTSYQFNFPADLCGLLIGARGKNIRRVMDQSGTVIVVKDKVYDHNHQLIIVEGSKNAVTKALDTMKSKFPKKKFPQIDWREAPPENPVLCSEIMQLHLPEGVHVDVIVSSVVSLNHVFVQQPTHPTFPMLENQNTTMNLCYSQDGMVPQLPRPIEVGVICAAPMYSGWFRAQVVQSYPELDEVDLRFVDYGGYCREPGNALRQIRSDFTSLPFEAVECYLANVIPPKGAESFPAEANAVLEQLVQGQVLQAEVVGQEEDGVPYIQLYILRNSRMYLVNRELVDRGVASWAESA